MIVIRLASKFFLILICFAMECCLIAIFSTFAPTIKHGRPTWVAGKKDGFISTDAVRLLVDQRKARQIAPSCKCGKRLIMSDVCLLQSHNQFYLLSSVDHSSAPVMLNLDLCCTNDPLDFCWVMRFHQSCWSNQTLRSIFAQSILTNWYVSD